MLCQCIHIKVPQKTVRDVDPAGRRSIKVLLLDFLILLNPHELKKTSSGLTIAHV